MTNDIQLNSNAFPKKQKRKKLKFRRVLFLLYAMIILVTFAFLFLFPTVFTLTNSFMSTTEISANYGKIFTGLGISGDGGRVFIAEKVNLQLIPDRVSFSQYSTVLLKSPEYLLKFWNSVFYVLPIVLFQLVVAAGASYCFARVETKFRSIVFFTYIILMLMPYQVTLVPNYIVMDKLNLLNTRWAIILPGIFSPFSVFILTKFMRRIPVSVVEAAKLDGVKPMREFFTISLPLIFDTISTFLIIGIAGFFTNQASLHALYSRAAEEYREVRTLGYQLFIYAQFGSKQETYPYAAALGLCCTLVAFPLTMLLRWALDKVNPDVQS